MAVEVKTDSRIKYLGAGSRMECRVGAPHTTRIEIQKTNDDAN